MRLLVWDFDGTLAHRPGRWSGALTQLLEIHSLPPPPRPDRLRAALQTGFPWHTPETPHPEFTDPDLWWDALSPVFEQAYRAGGIDAETAALLSPRVRNHYCDPASWRIFPDTIPALEALSANGWSHAILSNHVPELAALVRDLGLDRFFVRVVSSANCGCEKPHPAAFTAATMNLDPLDEIWMIGDSLLADIRGARQCGWKAVLARSQHPDADCCCESLAELDAILSRPPAD